MYIILLSGGSGKRLWPLSNEIRSKQFLRIMENETSMLQRMYEQLKRVSLSDKLIISTSELQRDSIVNQLGNVTTVIEPERRNTFPAIMLSCAYLHFKKKCDDDETVIVIPVDPYVDDSYFERLYMLDEVLNSEKPELVLMGAKPTYPSEKYGYIVPKTTMPISPVECFKEKPDLSAAKKLINNGALWNCGVFAFKLGFMIDKLKSTVQAQTYYDVFEQYSSFEKNSFDYAVTENCESIFSVSYDGEWKDIGTWNTLTDVMSPQPIGNVKMADDCENTHIINELGIPMVVMGAKDMVIAASPDGILVADKESSPHIKNYVDDINLRPMFEEREWGEYKVLDLTASEDGTKALTKHKKIKAGAEIEYQSHKYRSEVWTVLSGKCIITINGHTHEALAGDTYSIIENTKHGLKAVTDVEVIEIQVGKELVDDGTEFV